VQSISFATRCRLRSVVSLLIAACAALGAANAARAHDVELTKVSAKFTATGDYRIDLYYDVNAWVASVRPEHLTPEDLRQLETMSAEAQAKRLEELRDHILRNVRVRFDERKVTPTVEFVDNPERPASSPEHGSALLRIVRLSGTAPACARVFDFWASKSFGNIVLMLRHQRREGVVQQLLERGERSRPFELAAPTSQSGWRVARQYLGLGYEHILPWGPDHILFVIGLFLLGTKFGPLLWQVTAFTLAHSVSLALSTYGVVSVSPRIVEPLIALSIACVAIENICTSKLHPWRPVVVFCSVFCTDWASPGCSRSLGCREINSLLRSSPSMSASSWVRLASLHWRSSPSDGFATERGIALASWCRARC